MVVFDTFGGLDSSSVGVIFFEVGYTIYIYYTLFFVNISIVGNYIESFAMKRLMLLLWVLLPVLGVAQCDFEGAWDNVESLIKERNYRSAYRLADSVAALAEERGNCAQMVVGNMLACRAEKGYVAWSADSAMRRLGRLRPKLDDRSRLVLDIVVANQLWGAWDSSVVALRRLLEHDDVLKAMRMTEMKEYARLMDTLWAKGGCEWSEGSLNVVPTLYDYVVGCLAGLTNDARTSAELVQKLIDFHADDVELQIFLEQHRNEYMKAMGLTDSMLLEQYRRYGARTQVSRLGDFVLALADRCLLRKDYLQALAWLDTVEQRWPGSRQAAEAYNLRNEIVTPRYRFNMEQRNQSGLPIPLGLEYANMDTLWVRVVADFSDEERKGKGNLHTKDYVGREPLMERALRLDSPSDHGLKSEVFWLDELPQGRYVALFSPQRVTEECKAVKRCAFYCQQLAAVMLNEKPEKSSYDKGYFPSGLLMDATTGEPVAHQWVRVVAQRPGNSEPRVLDSAMTDEHGYYCFSDKPYKWQGLKGYIKETTQWDGFENELERVWPQSGGVIFDEERERSLLTTDRPVYRLGDTVRFVMVLWGEDNKLHTRAKDHEECFVRLCDPNGRMLDSLRLVTDGYGRCHGQVVLPRSGVNGSYLLMCSLDTMAGWGMNYRVRVEAYKQPRFAVTLNEAKGYGKLDDTVRMEGVVASFSGAPMSGVPVRYEVTRHVLYKGDKALVAQGELTTDEEGLFDFDFVALRDTQDYTRAGAYNFRVRVVVTDVGESHEATTDLYRGRGMRMIKVEQEEMVERMDTLRFGLHERSTLRSISGPVTVTLEKLWLPERVTPRSEVEERMMPRRDSVEWRRDWTTYLSKGDTALALADGKSVPAGWYRLKLQSAEDGDSVDYWMYVCVTPREESKVQSPLLLWAMLESDEVEVGDMIRLRFGSRMDRKMNVAVMMTRGNKLLWVQHYAVQDNMVELPIAVKEEWMDGLCLSLATSVDGRTQLVNLPVNVPFTTKRLQVKVEHFRDRLLPGSQEQITLSVVPPSGKSTRRWRTAMAMRMFDKALESYGWTGMEIDYGTRHVWSSSIAKNRTSNLTFGSGELPLTKKMDVAKDNWYGLGLTLVGGRFPQGFMSYFGPSGWATFGNEVVQEEEEIFSAVMVNDFSAAESVASRSVPKSAVQCVAGVGNAGEDPQPRVQMRTNMCPVAIFAPDLVSRKGGRVSLTYTVPDLMTSWTLQALAWDKQMRSGTLELTAVSQKQLMVQPNLPRFLRQGDHAQLEMKVSNLSEKTQQVTVRLEVREASSGQMVASGEKQVTLPSHRNETTCFEVAVPDDAALLTYKVVAVGQDFGDGEQGPLPVLPSRQLVTESRSMYLNGVGEKRYAIPGAEHLSRSSTSRFQSLTVDFVAEPLWLAVQSMPAMVERSNPSNLYLFNQYYTTTLAWALVNANPEVRKTFAQWLEAAPEALTSALETNEQVKQTLLEETPWLRDGKKESERKRHTAEFVLGDLEQQSVNLLMQLKENAQGDGWSWMPGGECSPYVTRHILQGFGRLKSLRSALGVEKEEVVWRERETLCTEALSYVDAAEYQHFRRMVEDTLRYDLSGPDSSLGRQMRKVLAEATDLDFLFTHSFFPKQSMEPGVAEMYDHYYRNLRRQDNPTMLNAMARKALVLYRHGDTTDARRLVRQLLERALVDDEMGLYWRENEHSWRCWYAQPVETQSLLVEALSEMGVGAEEMQALRGEVDAPEDVVGRMQQWLLKQRQTTTWGSDEATASAVAALMVGRQPARSETTIALGNEQYVIANPTVPFSVRKSGTEGEQLLKKQAQVQVSKQSAGPAWGAVYTQYMEDLDKVPHSEMGIRMQRQLVVVDGSAEQVFSEGSEVRLRVGQKVVVRTLIESDRALEYLQYKDGRPASFEPVSTRSGWRWGKGLGYYADVRNANTICYVDHLDKGRYVIETEYYVTHVGDFVLPPATIQCLYAPEFRSTTAGGRVEVTK